MGKESKKGGSGNRRKDWKSREKVFGKASTGHGFALDRKSKAIKKYKKFSKGMRDKSHDDKLIKPLAFDPLRDGKLEGVNEQQGNSFKKEKYSRTFKKTKAKSLHMEYERQKEERQQNRKDKEHKRREHAEKIKKGIQSRQKLAQKLMKRTKKGQPVLANHIDYLLKKIKD